MKTKSIGLVSKVNFSVLCWGTVTPVFCQMQTAYLYSDVSTDFSYIFGWATTDEYP